MIERYPFTDVSAGVGDGCETEEGQRSRAQIPWHDSITHCDVGWIVSRDAFSMEEHAISRTPRTHNRIRVQPPNAIKTLWLSIIQTRTFIESTSKDRLPMFLTVTAKIAVQCPA